MTSFGIDEITALEKVPLGSFADQAVIAGEFKGKIKTPRQMVGGKMGRHF